MASIAVSDTPRSGLLDLEKELSCSICTDTLYQPLTLLDCLHTFCGSCLKLWFAWQASQADADPDNYARRLNPYTCPSCRAHVRGTRPDAKITTLLEMYLAANPDKSKSEEEKEEMRAKYKPGDDVIPRLHASEEDRRMVREVRDLSLQEAGRVSGHGYERGTRHQPRARRGHDDERREQAVQLEHQSSLRSIISRDDMNSEAMEDEIMRQILEEGLLDSVDWNSVTPEQMDELSARIAEAYSRRRDEREHERPRAMTGPQSRRTPSRSPVGSPRHSPRRGHARSESETERSARDTASVQREDLLQANPSPRHRRRSSESRRQTAPVESTTSIQAPAARSATDLHSSRPDSSSSGRRRRSSHSVTGLDVSHRHVLRHTDSPPTQSPVQSPPQSPPISGMHASRSSPRGNSPSDSAPSLVPLEHTINQQPSLVASANYHAHTQVTAPSSHLRATSFSNSVPGLGRLKGFPEPSISCNRCEKPNLQYHLHHNCNTCLDGKFNLCDRCYKQGKGCLNWYGFGHMAWKKYQDRGAPSPELPHILLGTRYRRPRADELVPGNPNLAQEAPQKRRQVGAFCYVCHDFAEDFFYKCDACNDGEWGYCKKCVNQGRCCTHPLLPLAWVYSKRQKSSASDMRQGIQATFAPTPDPAMIQPFPPSKTGPARQYRPLTVTTTCDRCKRPVPPNESRFHCPNCLDGAFELCKDCYSQIQNANAIRFEDGERGWRRCPSGHRMIVYYYHDTSQGQRRYVVNDLVGGHFLKDEPDGAAGMTPKASERVYNWSEGHEGHSTTVSRAALQPQPGQVSGGPSGARFPPDGGVGKRCMGWWSWIPEEGVEDELMFPRGAEITEVLNVTDEWWEGSYAGAKGVFPAKFVRTLEVVTM